MINFWSDVYKIIAECDKNVSFLEEKIFPQEIFCSSFPENFGNFFLAL